MSVRRDMARLAARLDALEARGGGTAAAAPAYWAEEDNERKIPLDKMSDSLARKDDVKQMIAEAMSPEEGGG